MKLAIKGIAGSGKTTLCKELLLKKLEEGYTLSDVFYTSFTRSAIASARKKLIEAGFDEEEVRESVRTMHSFCFRLLGLEKSDLMRREDYQQFFDFIFEKLGIMLEFNPKLLRESFEVVSDEDIAEEPDGNKVITIYDILRNKYLIDIDEITDSKWFKIEETSSFNFENRLVDRRTLKTIVMFLKQFKRDMGKLDYTDLLFQVWKLGLKPEKRIFFFDEFQDFTRLQYEVYKLWTEHAEFVVIAGDELQSQFDWMGGDYHFFIEEFKKADKKIVLEKSYRVPQHILDYVWNFLKLNNAEMIDIKKPISLSGFSGDVINFNYCKVSDIVEIVKKLEGDTIILTRTNYLKRVLKEELSKNGVIFYEYGRGKRYWTPLLVTLYNALLKFKKNHELNREEVLALILHSYVGGHIKRGVQTKLRRGEIELDKEVYKKMDLLRFFEPRIFGYSFEQLVNMLRVDGKEVLIERYNVVREMIKDVKVYVSTIHSFKGLEADNVVYVTNLTSRVLKNFNKQQEIINSYVAMTRPRKRLLIVNLLEFKPNILIFPRG